jgi:hypothetical protein
MRERRIEMPSQSGNKSTVGVALEDPPITGEVEKGPKEKRLSLILSDSVFDDLVALSKERRTSMTEIVRLALGLVKVAIREAKAGNKLVVARPNGEVIKELILPG